jgi:EmrB/QacA subfamily drug resistance transporter
VIVTAQLMILLDATVVNVALPSIQRALHFSVATIVWVTTAYSITLGGLLIFGGRTGDLFGRRRMFMIGIGIFAAASLLGGIAPGSAWLVITRGLQGVGAAIASPAALSLVVTTFAEGPPRNKALGVYSAASATGGAIGLLVGGVLVALVGWRWVFFVNVPVGALILYLAPRVLRETEAVPSRLDWRGAVTVTTGMVLLVYGLTNAATHHWGSPGTLVPLTAAGALLLVFVWMELRTPHPLTPLHIIADRRRAGAYLTMLCVGAAFMSIFFFLTLFFQHVQHASALRTGLYFLPFVLFTAGISQLSARLVPRLGAGILIAGGAVILAVGLWWLGTIHPDSTYRSLVGPLLLIGLGVGDLFVPLRVVALSGVAPRESGLAAALINTGQQLGGAIGLAALSTVAVSAAISGGAELAHGSHAVATHRIATIATTHGYAVAFRVGAAIALGALVIAVSMIGIGRPKAGSGDQSIPSRRSPERRAS